MKVLVCGANGFIGRHIVSALRAGGHDPVPGVRRAMTGAERVINFVDPHLNDWPAVLAGIDAVVTAIGVLRSARANPIEQVHQEGPIALFDACASHGVRRVVHISALGIAQSSTAYAQTKRAAEEHLLGLNAAGRLNGTLLRPSIVYGPGGASAQLFDTLAALPVLVLPGAVRRCQAQPVHVTDVAQVVGRVLDQSPTNPAALSVVGPRPLSLEAFIAGLRAQRGRRPAAVLTLPEVLTHASARLGDWLPFSPWSTEALALLQQPTTADAGPCAALLGRPLLDPLHFAEPSAAPP